MSIIESQVSLEEEEEGPVFDIWGKRVLAAADSIPAPQSKKRKKSHEPTTDDANIAPWPASITEDIGAAPPQEAYNVENDQSWETFMKDLDDFYQPLTPTDYEELESLAAEPEESPRRDLSTPPPTIPEAVSSEAPKAVTPDTSPRHKGTTSDLDEVPCLPEPFPKEPQSNDNLTPTWTGPRFSDSEENPTIIQREEVTQFDIFCGRQYRGSPHKGNVEYQKTIRANKEKYQRLKGSHKKKTTMTKDLLKNVIRGRFIGIYGGGKYLLTEQKARSKVRQALSEKN